MGKRKQDNREMYSTRDIHIENIAKLKCQVREHETRSKGTVQVIEISGQCGEIKRIHLQGWEAFRNKVTKAIRLYKKSVKQPE